MRIGQYLMVGKFFETKGTNDSLDEQLARYGLVSDKNHKTPTSVRRESDPVDKERYEIICPYKNDDSRLAVGTLLLSGEFPLAKPTFETQDIKEPLEEVLRDIPDASLLQFLYDGGLNK